MVGAFNQVSLKLRLWAVMSSICLACAATVSHAHEVLPTLSDMTVVDDTVLRFEMTLNAEAFLAGIDLDVIEDTDDAEGTTDYKTLRALPASDLAQRLPELLRDWANQQMVVVDGAPQPLSLGSYAFNDPTDLEQPRQTNIVMDVYMPPASQSVVINWPAGNGAFVLRQQGVNEPFTGLLQGGTSSPEIALSGGGQATLWQAFVNYIPVGFDHILPKGLDHILFVLGLFFLSTRLRPLIWQVSAFTLAHTVTLALGAMGWVNVPGSIVEPLIAASIVYVAVENIFTSGLSRWRPFVIFGFGLLHGLGFASVLGEFGLPEGQFIPALIGFNVGVEFGQLTVIAIAFVLVGWLMKRDWYRRAIAIPASCVIAAVGAYWCIERVFF
ncbi:HupE/UreJ family protein [Ascidiaceihabitans sp.]|uniref:HupE/UreJ family protein n=1 Tax=Ascidiaceihabitans sp. TaxID=1872644 RepID=UPI0032979719